MITKSTEEISLNVYPYRKELGIAFEGNFEPHKISPQWLFTNDLISAAECEDAKELIEIGIGFLDENYTEYFTDWFIITINKKQLIVTIQSEDNTERMRDIVTGILQSKPNLSITKVAVVIDVHYDLTIEEFSAINTKLIPSGIWSNDDNAELWSLIAETKRKDDLSGYIRTRIEPSEDIQREKKEKKDDHKSKGVFISITDVLTANDSIYSVTDLIRYFTSHWYSSLQNSYSAINNLTEKFNINS